MLDEGTLRERFPEIPWDQPQRLTITGGEGTSFYGYVCRYCTALDGIKGKLGGEQKGVFQTWDDALDHIEAVHHD